MKISQIIKLTSGVVLILAIVNFVNLFLLYQSVIDRNQTASKQINLIQLGADLLESSDYLTNEVRAYVQSGEKEHFDNYWKEVNETKTRDRVVTRLKELNTPPDLLALLEMAKTNSDTLIKLEDQAIKAVQTNDFNQARELVFGKQYQDGKKIITEPLNQFHKELKDWAQSESDKAQSKMTSLLWLTIIFVILNIIAMLFTFYILYKKVAPLQKITEIANQVAQGDLHVKYLETKTKDEISELSRAINQMVENLRKLIENISSTSQQVAASSEELMASAEQTRKATEQISNASQEVAVGTKTQVQSAKEATQIVDEISKGMNQVAYSIQSVADASVSTNQETTKGTQVVLQTVEQMNVVHDKVESTSKVVHTLGERSEEIGQIVSIITEISNQTNLLALNAAIEAARAGESGRGFAVVADEVRKLAEQSGTAAEKIRTLILEIQAETQKAVLVMNEGTQAVDEGIEKVHQTGESFKSITRMIEEVSAQSQGVSAIVEEVNASVQGVVGMMETVSHISEQSSSNTQNVAEASEEQLASMEEISSSATSMAKMAEGLQILISRFKV